MCCLRTAALAALSLGVVAGQEITPQKTVLQNTGKPIRLPVSCGDEDMQAFGMTCSPDAPCPVYLELSAVEPLGTTLFVTGNLHNGSSTMYSVLLVSEDGGRTWFEGHGRMRGAGLEQIQFFDLASGWIGGQILGPLPRDPFFLITTDGGKNWRRRDIFGESRVGAIERFWFDSPRSGGLLIDRVQAGETGARYEFHETMTGGESWMIREVSAKPIQPKGARPPRSNPDWRLSADRATQSYQVERRQGQSWQPVASFLIQTGECKPEEKPLPEPPPPSGVEEPKELPVAPGGVFRPGAPKPRPSKPPAPAGP